jgi:lysophospholipase L1-like esterase
MTRSRRVLYRLAAILIGLLVALLLLEGGLRLAAPLMSGLRGGATSAKATILCVGDSHTFGLHVPPNLSYPAQLQQRLDASAQSIGVVNYGVPGRNSGALLQQLASYLDDVRPDVVLVLVGFNDSWNFDATADATPPWWSSLRVVRLARLIRLNLGGAHEGGAPRVYERDDKVRVEDGGVERAVAVGGPGLEPLQGEALTQRVTTHVERMVAMVRDHGARPVLLTYATENGALFVDLNQNARELATQLDVPLIDLAAALRALVANQGYAAWFFTHDDHPNARGYGEVARVVASELTRLGLVQPAANSSSTAAAGSAKLTRTAGDATTLAFTIEAPPNTDFQIVLSTKAEPPIDIEGLRVPLGADPLVFQSLEFLNLRGRTDAGGRAEASIQKSRLGDAAESRLYAVVAAFEPGRLPAVSERITIE